MVWSRNSIKKKQKNNLFNDSSVLYHRSFTAVISAVCYWPHLGLCRCLKSDIHRYVWSHLGPRHFQMNSIPDMFWSTFLTGWRHQPLSCLMQLRIAIRESPLVISKTNEGITTSTFHAGKLLPCQYPGFLASTLTSLSSSYQLLLCVWILPLMWSAEVLPALIYRPLNQV